MKLSPCKHCGSVAHITKSVTDPHLCWSVSCSNLDCGMTTRAFSQQQQAVNAWQRSAEPAQTYSHRNGETEAPIASGKYWFAGEVSSEIATERYKVTDTVDVNDNHAYNDVHGETLHLWNYAGQWWGPVLAPWEQPQ